MAQQGDQELHQQEKLGLRSLFFFLLFSFFGISGWLALKHRQIDYLQLLVLPHIGQGYPKRDIGLVVPFLCLLRCDAHYQLNFPRIPLRYSGEIVLFHANNKQNKNHLTLAKETLIQKNIKIP